jgi:vancomycin permeability regulator SanA
VLGAGVVGEQPSPLLRDRIEGAVELFESGRVDLLVMSGDNSTEYYDEPTVMRRYAIDQGIPATSVAADYAGRRTWDTCTRAHDVFGIDDAIVVTNSFHVDRAVTTCRAGGVDATGFSVSDSGHSLGNRARWRARELAASGRALADAWWLRPEPAVGGDRIDPWDPCELRESLAPSDAERSAEAFTDAGC